MEVLHEGGFAMSKRRYTKVQALLPVIEARIASVKSHREIEEELGLEGD